MANSARVSLEIEFADGTNRVVKPLTIAKLRKFMKVAERLDFKDSTKLSDKEIDAMMDAAQIIMENVDNNLAANREQLEDAIDVEIFWKLMQVAMGNKVEDPNE